MTAAEAYVERMRARFRWRPSKGRVCPRGLLRKHCRLTHPGRYGRNGLYHNTERCLCELVWDPARDHAYLWVDADHRKVLSVEPALIDAWHLDAYRRVLEPAGLVLDVVEQCNYWNTGAAMLVCRRERRH